LAASNEIAQRESARPKSGEGIRPHHLVAALFAKELISMLLMSAPMKRPTQRYAIERIPNTLIEFDNPTIHDGALTQITL
jgi:hypothetical protein